MVDDVNTQFFNTESIDTDGKDRNAKCIGPDGKAGCVIDISLDSPPAEHDVRLVTMTSNSSIGAVPSDCSIDPTIPLADLHGAIVMYGHDPHTGSALGELPVNGVTHAGGSKEHPVEMHYDLCPRGVPDSHGVVGCAAGTTYAPLKLLGDASAANGLLNFAPFEKLVVGQPADFHHHLFAASGSDACNRVTGAAAATEDWSGYPTFNVRACIVSPFNERMDGNNCVVTPLRLVVSKPENTGNADSARYDKDYSASAGDKVIGVSGSFYTHNDIDLSGATTDSQAKASITGWFGFTLFHIWATGAANVAIVGSYADAGVEVLGHQFYSYNETVPEVHWTKDLTYAKSLDYYYNYGIAGIGLDVDAGITGSAGITGALDIVAETGSGTAPFADSTTIGTCVATVTPSVSLQLNARATVNLAVTKGEVDGSLTVLDVELPAVGTLHWGLISGPALVMTADASLNMTLKTLAGDLHASVEVLEPKWCHCGKWCPGYPCKKWSTVWDDDIVSYKGLSTSLKLYTQKQVQLTLQ